MTLAIPELHPADQAAADRIGRTLTPHGERIAPAVNRLRVVAVGVYRCDHGAPLMECRTCIELLHAEKGSITVRAAYAFGEWPPAPAR